MGTDDQPLEGIVGILSDEEAGALAKMDVLDRDQLTVPTLVYW